MLKPLDITQTTFDAYHNNAATVVYEAVYEAASDAVSEAVSDAVSEAVSEVDASQFHELSRKLNQPQMKIQLFIKNQNSESENV